jgi:hypothetical protein
MTGDTDEQLDGTSRDLLRSLGELKDLETRKRHTERSTDQFHDLAGRVSDKSKEVVDLALHEEVAGADDSPLPSERQDGRPGDWTDGGEMGQPR